MSSRRPLQPKPALAGDASSARSTRMATTATTATTAAGSHDMADHVLDDVPDAGSVVSGLTSLSGDDDFERRMIQNARDERRRHDVLQGRVQPFRKARTHARVGLTLANLERNDAQRGPALASPPSSSSSTRSDPPLYAPAAWGRKGRTSLDHLRSMRGDEPPQQTPAPPSPLSQKRSRPGTHATPRNDSSGEWDLTFDLNEASMLVSTPYVPRNTTLDDIRGREVDSLREMDRQRETAPEDQRRPTDAGSAARLPMTVYRKSVETVGGVARGVVASAERQTPRPFSSRRADSQDLLRRLARASNSPSPRETRPARASSTPSPQETRPARPQPLSSPPAAVAGTSQPQPDDNQNPTPVPVDDTAAASTSTPQDQDQREQRHDTPHDTPHDGTTPDVPSSAPTADDADTTPLPVERAVLQPNTPYVMGGWLDTPGPRTSRKPVEPRHGLLQPPQPTAPIEAQQQAEEGAKTEQPLPPRPRLPGSALDALVQEARANHDYGDDTLHSLEDLMNPRNDTDLEEDTLERLPLPTSEPRTEAERTRHAEMQDLRRLTQHARSTSTSIRDTTRGLSRLRTTVEHIDVESPSAKMPVLGRDLGHEFSPWAWFCSFFWNERLKTRRELKNAPLRMWGGVTLFGILLTLSFIWWASETVACEMFCHPEYASYSPYPFAVNMDAPQRGVVIPTLIYRALFKNWASPIVLPIASLSSWIWASLWSLVSSVTITGLGRLSHEATANSGPAMAAHTYASWKLQEDVHAEDSWDWSMAEDEVLRR